MRDGITLPVVAVTLVAYAMGAFRRLPTETWGFYLFYIGISSPAQEFLFRASLSHLLTSLLANRHAKVFISSVLYSLVHIIYRDPATLVITFLMGLVWGYSYERYRNLAGVSASHAVLGLISILTGAVD